MKTPPIRAIEDKLRVAMGAAGLCSLLALFSCVASTPPLTRQVTANNAATNKTKAAAVASSSPEQAPIAATDAGSPAAPSDAGLPSSPIDAATLAKLRAAAYLVWGRDVPEREKWRRKASQSKKKGWLFDWDYEIARTHAGVTYALAADGSIMERVPNVVFAAAGRLFSWSVRDVHFPRVGCKVEAFALANEDDEDFASLREQARGEAAELAREPTLAADEASLVDLESGERRIVAAYSETQFDGLIFFESDATLIATVGDLAFVRRDDEVEICGGAHGSTSFFVEAVDLRQKSSTRFADQAAAAWLRPSALARVRREASPVLSEMLRGVSDPLSASDVEVTDIRASFDISGRLLLEARAMYGTAYAFTNSWQSYMVETLVRLPSPDALTMRDAFAPHAKPPAMIAAFLRAHPTFVMGGYALAADFAKP